MPKPTMTVPEALNLALALLSVKREELEWSADDADSDGEAQDYDEEAEELAEAYDLLHAHREALLKAPRNPLPTTKER